MTYVLEILSRLDTGVSIDRLGLFFVVILSTFMIRYIFLYILDRKIALSKIAKSEIDSMIINTIRDPLGHLILVQGFYIAIMSLQLPEKIGPFEIISIIHTVYILAISFIVLYFAFRVIDIIVKKTVNNVNEY